MILVVALLLYIVWRKITSTKGIPTHRGIVELEAHTTGAAPVKSCWSAGRRFSEGEELTTECWQPT